VTKKAQGNFRTSFFVYFEFPYVLFVDCFLFVGRSQRLVLSGLYIDIMAAAPRSP
jgi:hypothetical protein